jgi:hypothetical protein
MRIGSVHQRENGDLQTRQRANTKAMVSRIEKAFQERTHALKHHQDAEREAMQAHHRAEHKEVTFKSAKEDIKKNPPSEQFKEAHNFVQAPPPMQQKSMTDILNELKSIAGKKRDRGDFERER